MLCLNHTIYMVLNCPVVAFRFFIPISQITVPLNLSW
uniref:Uncharacterized protein n=1 Tax=Rhizophora mucronata TaxID=61149 RepID=A0A2P2Q5A2_RHIMU